MSNVQIQIFFKREIKIIHMEIGILKVVVLLYLSIYTV